MSGRELAPVALFVYRRPWHTQRTIQALSANTLAGRTHLYVFSDGPGSRQDVESVRQVRAYVRKIKGFRSLEIIERRENVGLSGSVINGVTRLCEEHGRVIVLEDDIVVSPFFLEFMNSGLDLYELHERVISIHGYVYPTHGKLPDLFFLRGADCWGWGTWKRGWDLFEADGPKLLRQLHERGLERDFDFNGTYAYTQMLNDQVKGKNKSWAIRWYASAFLQDRLTLYPGCSLVHNIGNDSSGIHCGSTNVFGEDVSSNAIKMREIEINENDGARKEFEAFFASIRIKPTWQERLKRRVFRRLRC